MRPQPAQPKTKFLSITTMTILFQWAILLIAVLTANKFLAKRVKRTAEEVD